MVFNKYQGTATKPLSREIVYTLLQKNVVNLYVIAEKLVPLHYAS